jgi:hypothetical protein
MRATPKWAPPDVVSSERGDMGYWVSSRNVVVVIRARRPAWWTQLKIWLGRFRNGKP